MPTVMSIADLRDKYREISHFCHANAEPIFLTENGVGDLAVMSIESYEKLVGKGNPQESSILRHFGTLPGAFGGDGIAFQREARDGWR